jgi:hypothetical protein
MEEPLNSLHVQTANTQLGNSMAIGRWPNSVSHLRLGIAICHRELFVKDWPFHM